MDRLPTYPKSPALTDFSFLLPSVSFKKQVKKVVNGIRLFAATYFGTMGVTAVGASACIYGGLKLITTVPSIITIVLGGCVMGVGAMLLLYFVKFLFASRKISHTDDIEVLSSEHPDLYTFVHQIAHEVGAPTPKKIFLSADVNAGVSYDSSFWSMFFPVEKNLTIGFGLMNSLNMSEFKAVLAHEFGHFSQDSMKLGSYVYTANKIIYDMVYKYDRWDDAMMRWANQGGIIGFFGKITSGIANGIRHILQKMYNIVHVRYMGLSREMEYHADLFAVKAVGSQQSVSALRRVNFGSYSFAYAMEQLSTAVEKKMKVKNAYALQKWSIAHLSQKHEMALENGLPVIEQKHLDKVLKSRVIYQDQWASHPSLEDREANITAVQIPSEKSTTDPFSLLENPEALQEKFTTQLYKNIPNQKELKEVPLEKITKKILKEDAKNFKIPEVFNKYYSGRLFDEFDIDKTIKKLEKGKVELKGFGEIFAPKNHDYIMRSFQNEADVDTLNSIKQGYIETDFFEFDNKRYTKENVNIPIKQLNKEIEKAQSWLKRNDKQAFLYHFEIARLLGKADEFVELYKTQFGYRGNMEVCGDWLNHIQQNYYTILSLEYRSQQDIYDFLSDISEIEVDFKKNMRLAKKAGDLTKLKGDLKDLAKKYIKEDAYFISRDEFNQDQFREFIAFVADIQEYFVERYIERLKEIFNYQAALLKEAGQ